MSRRYNGAYTGRHLDRVAFPMGGFGAGMMCLEGAGALSHVSLLNRPEVFNEPLLFAALHVHGVPHGARVVEGPVPSWKVFGPGGTGNGAGGKTYGLPRFSQASFSARFPFGTVRLRDAGLPLRVDITGWSPFVPGQADESSLPVFGLEYTLRNTSGSAVEGVFSYHARNFLRAEGGTSAVRRTRDGFVLAQEGSAAKPEERRFVAVSTNAAGACVNAAWFRGGWFDPLTMVWRDVEQGAVREGDAPGEGDPSPGASMFVPFRLEAGQKTTVRLRFCWYVTGQGQRIGDDPDGCGCEGPAVATETCERKTYEPWYSGRFAGIDQLAAFWRKSYARLRRETARFTRCFYDTTLPPEVVEAVSANLAILKSPTVMRQTDGRLWCWEGCCDSAGCCHGSCTHVWNYAQALPHLFPDLERTLRLTEFIESQDERGHQEFRAALPIRPIDHCRHAAADGQLGGIMKVYREWRISGDTEWMRGLWPRVKASMDYCVATWDPDGRGVPVEPHHNTYDIEFWGPDGMCGSFYVGALLAAARMGAALGEDVGRYEALHARGRDYMERELFDGEYFVQKVEWEGLRAGRPDQARSLVGDRYSTEALELMMKEGPKYQYGSGCLSDGVLGAWMARMCGLGDILDADKVSSHVAAVCRYNFVDDLTLHANPQRPSFALGAEAGLLLCTWPKGGEPALPFVYSKEVWTGIEYQVAGHLMMMGLVEEGLRVVRGARDRYDGRVREPFNEYECGHWYARALSSYGLLQAMTGVRYDAVERVLYVEPPIAGDFRVFLSAATGYGTVVMEGGQARLEVRSGTMDVREIRVKLPAQP